MGLFSNIRAMKDVQKIKAGGTAKLSNEQIVNLIINLPDANRNLSPEQFRRVYALFQEISRDKEQREMTFSGYLDAATRIIDRFNAIAPYELYCGERP